MIQQFIALLFPNLCHSCDNPLGVGEEFICVSCLLGFPETNYHANKDNNPVAQKFYGKLEIAGAFAHYRFKKGSLVQHTMHKLKYKHSEDLGEFLGKRYGAELTRSGVLSQVDWIVPVPLHKDKLRKRGFNQAEAIGRGLSDSTGIFMNISILTRKVYTETQTKKSRLERWKNMDEVFEVLNDQELVDKSVLIVDDIITTGSTVESCVRTLLKHGAKEVMVACIAAAE